MDHHDDVYCPISIQSNYSDESSQGVKSLPSRNSNGVSFLFLRQGCALITINGMSYMLESDQCVCMMPGAAFFAQTGDSARVFFYDLVTISREFLFRADELAQSGFFAGLMGRSASLPKIISASTADGERILRLLGEIVLMLKAKPLHYEIGCMASACMLLHRLSALGDECHQTATEDKSIGKAIRYIESNYMDKISIDTLASVCCMSKYHFIRLFYEVTQQTPIEYINSFRIQVVCRRLRENDNEKVISIALAAGFNDLSNFNRMFKRIIGVTPAEYRRREQEKRDASNTIYYSEEDNAPPFYYFFP